MARLIYIISIILIDSYKGGMDVQCLALWLFVQIPKEMLLTRTLLHISKDW